MRLYNVSYMNASLHLFLFVPNCKTVDSDVISFRVILQSGGLDLELDSKVIHGKDTFVNNRL